VALDNHTGQLQATDVWVRAVKPNGSLTSVLRYWVDVSVQPGGGVYPGVVQEVPEWAPLGMYEYIVYCGDYATVTSIDSASFEFTVVTP